MFDLLGDKLAENFDERVVRELGELLDINEVTFHSFFSLPLMFYINNSIRKSDINMFCFCVQNVNSQVPTMSDRLEIFF